MPIERKPKQNRGTPVCVVTTDIACSDMLQEASVSMVALAQKLAAAGNDVTLLWVSDDLKTAEEAEKSIHYFSDTFGIELDLFRPADENVHRYNGPEYRSFGVYKYLKRNRFDIVYFPLENGLAYYTLLGKETGVYQQRPQLIVAAHSPLEWVAETDRFFLKGTEQIKVAFMEKYCTQEPDKLICISSGLFKWFHERNWVLAKNCQIVPALTPFEWSQVPDDSSIIRGSQQQRELVLIASHRFRDGMTLFCDMLDEISRLDVKDLRVTAIGEFGRILGEHTGGMLLRRGRLWRFPIRLMPKLSSIEGIRYAKRHNGIAIIPNFESATGYCVSECIRLGVPFVATSVGGNVEHVAQASVPKCLAAPTAAALAATLAKAIENPHIAAPRWNDETKERLWYELDRVPPHSQTTGERKNLRKTTSPLVSVIIAHHDRPQYLLQAVASLRDQDYPNFEVILVDDGSKLPESHIALERLEDDFGKRGWKIIRGENRYVGAARNTGVKASRGEMVILLDDDNALYPEALSTFVRALETSQSDVCMALSRSVFQSNIPGSDRSTYVTYIPLGGCLDLSLLGNVFGDTISIYRRSVFDEVGFQLEKHGYMVEDWEFFIRMALSGLKLRLIPEVLFWYRISTQGRYRTSNYYDNLTPILATCANHNFKGFEYLYRMYVGQNIGPYHSESAKVNLTYSPSDEKYLELANLEPNGPEAITLLIKIAAGEAREDTAINLLAQTAGDGFAAAAVDVLQTQPGSQTALEAAVASLTIDRRLVSEDLLMMETWTSASASTHPFSYVEKPDRLFLESASGDLSVAVLPAACPASTTSLLSVVSLQQAASEPAEFLALLCPMHVDPLLAAKSALKERKDGASGWIRVSNPYRPTVLEAHLATPSSIPMNLVLAVRSPAANSKPVLGCFAGIIVRTSIEDRVTRRPRLGPPPYKLRARPWIESERMSARLVTEYKSELPLLLFAKETEGGIFIRPSAAGPVVAVIKNGFPAFAREVLAKVEIAHDEASAFDFAMALTLPHSPLNWRAAGPRNPVAFSGWIRVEEKFKLHDIKLRVRELIPTPLSISMAVRLPRGSNPNPSNAFWRSLVFFWDQ